MASLPLDWSPLPGARLWKLESGTGALVDGAVLAPPFCFLKGFSVFPADITVAFDDPSGAIMTKPEGGGILIEICDEFEDGIYL